MFLVPIDSLNKQSNYYPHPSGEPVAQNALQSDQVSIMAIHRNRARNHMFYLQTSCFLLTPHFLMSFYTEKKKGNFSKKSDNPFEGLKMSYMKGIVCT